MKHCGSTARRSRGEDLDRHRHAVRCTETVSQKEGSSRSRSAEHGAAGTLTPKLASWELTRNAVPVLGILPAQLRFDSVAAALGISGAGKPLGLLLLGGTANPRRRSGWRTARPGLWLCGLTEPRALWSACASWIVKRHSARSLRDSDHHSICIHMKHQWAPQLRLGKPEAGRVMTTGRCCVPEAMPVHRGAAPMEQSVEDRGRSFGAATSILAETDEEPHWRCGSSFDRPPSRRLEPSASWQPADGVSR